MSDMSKEVANDYRNSLADLVNNSKPQITFLTLVADESKEYASAVVDVIMEHAYRVRIFRILYLAMYYFIALFI